MTGDFSCIQLSTASQVLQLEQGSHRVSHTPSSHAVGHRSYYYLIIERAGHLDGAVKMRLAAPKCVFLGIQEG